MTMCCSVTAVQQQAVAAVCLPSVVVRVVCIAYSIEVELLEQLYVSQHGVLCDSLAPPLLVHVAVHSLDHDGHVVVQQLPTLDLILPESNLHQRRACHRQMVQERACGADETRRQMISELERLMRCLCR